MNANEVSLIRAIRGPVTLITLGVLFALNNFTPYQFRPDLARVADRVRVVEPVAPRH